MKETLQCTQCDAKWERTRVRGRKPVVCPECAQINIEEGQGVACHKVVKEQLVKSDFKYPSVSYWFCPDCNQTLTVHVGLDYIPSHNCRVKRNMPIAMQRTNRKELKEITI